ncbi:MAG TPA: rhomboid family intramembrane serine protease [Bryobacteraceae bacterium]|nr:rhomboid family intramembrane serine protease [Bryobacteraceae bacterium]
MAYLRTQRAGFTDRLMPNGKMATALLLLVNCAFFAAMHTSNSQALAQYGAKWVPAIVHGDWYRLITAGYLHVQGVHILMNMIGLYNLGPLTEEIYGTGRMFTAYTVATVTGFALSSVWTPLSPSLGASAGLFGLLGALIAVGIHSKSFIARHLQQQCLLNAAIGFAMGGMMSMVDNAAHLGGLAGGFAVAYFSGFPQSSDAQRNKIWNVAGGLSLLVTGYSFYQLTMQMLRDKAF